MREMVVVGKLGAAHGINGRIRIHSFTEPPSNIFNYSPWFLSSVSCPWYEVKFTHPQDAGKKLLAVVDGCSNREQAQKLVGMQIGVLRSQLPPTSVREYYWHDLEGLNVVNIKGAVLGKVTGLMDTGANDVLIVKNKSEFTIPFLLDSVIKKVDLEKQVITVDWEII